MRLPALALMLAMTQAPALAATTTVTFDTADVSFDDAFRTAFLEDQGFKAQSSVDWWDGGNITLHDDGGLRRSTIERLDGAAFTPLAADLTLISRYLRTGPDKIDVLQDDFDKVLDWADDGLAQAARFRFIGRFADGHRAILDVTAKAAWEMTTVTFGPAFDGIVALTAKIMYPDGVTVSHGRPNITLFDVTELSRPNQDWCPEFCSELVIDNLVVLAPDPVAPVPLPATALLLGAALVPLALRRRR